MAKLTSPKLNLGQINLMHIFDTKFQMEEMPVEAAKRCSEKSFLVQLQASSFWPEILVIGTNRNFFTDIFQRFCLNFKNTVFQNPSQWLFPK